MKTVLQGVAAVALAAVAYLCLTLSFAVRTTSKHLSDISMQVGDTLRQTNLELDELHRLTLEAGLTAMEARKASAKELAFLDQANAQLVATTSQATQTLAALERSANQATESTAMLSGTAAETIASIRPTVASATAELEALRLATQHLDVLVSDPAIQATASNVASTSADVHQMADEGKDAFHAWLHPTFVQRLFGLVKTGAEIAAGAIF